MRDLQLHHTPVPRPVRAVLVVLALVVGALVPVVVAATTPASAATDPCSTGNKIACENSKPGTPRSVWDISGAGSDDIQGFSTDISTNLGGRVDFKIDTDASAYSIVIYRTGWYGGDGARQVATVTPSATLPQRQPNCISDTTTELYDCGNWAVSASWTVPSTAVSGVYIAKLTIPSTGASSHITFIVRDDSSRSDVVFQTSDPTWQAYNTYGGSDFYQGAANGRAYKVSYNRPVLTRSGPGGRDFYFANEYPLVRFMERNGYDVSYIAGVDTDRAGSLLKNHKTFLSVGHDEYWSGKQRANVEAARDAGVNLQFLSGNEAYWRTRYEASADSSKTAYRTLVTYKETWSGYKSDPATEWTGTFRDPRFASQANGAGRPENALTGQLYLVNHDDLAVKVSAAEGKNRLWRGTSLARQSAGAVATLAPHTVGYESDEDVDNGFRPAGTIRLSTTTGSTPEYLTDFGNTTVPGTTTHHLTMYRAPSGALVFGAGSVQWTWGLDTVHDSPFDPEPADIRMQQAQVNLFADMGAQPTTLMSGLTAATRSTDTTAPTATITSPSSGATIANGATTTVTGTASDTGGGVVAGVEVSTDAGDTWHPATSGTSSWSYTYVQHGTGTNNLRVRATDDSANTGAVTSRSVNVTCPCSVYGATVPTAPTATTAVADTNAAELGMRFSADVDGFVTGVRFFKGSGNAGTHTGSLWSTAGQRLASVTFTGESTSGWQTATFATPVAVAAGQTYVVSYTAPAGRWSSQDYAFSSLPLAEGPLTVAGGFGATPAGVYGNAGTFPDLSYRNASYYVDPLFVTAEASAPALTFRSPSPGTSSVPRTTTVKATLSKAVVSSSVKLVLKDSNGTAVAGSTAYDATTRTVTFTPSSSLAGGVRFTAAVSATDAQGRTVSASAGTWSFVSAQPAGAVGVCPCSLFSDDTTPTTIDSGDTQPVSVGVRFSPTVNGTVSAVRYYRGAGNPGTHTATLWDAATRTVLATGTFTDESNAGWQTLTFTTPVSVKAGAEYVASYRAPAGRYSATPNAFAAADLSRGPLGVSSSAGAYTYTDGFPSASSATSYLVDVVFDRAAPSIALSSTTPASGATDVDRTSSVSATFSTSIKSGATLTLSSSGTAIAATTTLDSSGTTLTATPSAALPAGADVTAVLSGVTATSGPTLAGTTWTFRTAAAGTASTQTLFGSAVPAVGAEDDSSPVEVGTAFSVTKPGVVKALRFYKGTGNNGTHTGSLWSSTGTRLATVTFTSETATGWQRAVLSTPYRLTPGTQYVVSYLAQQGHYADTPRFFSEQKTAGAIVAPAGDNGRYLYGSSGGFPAYSFQSTAYFADVEFVADAATMTLSGTTPASGATGVSRSATPSASFSGQLADGWSMTLKAGSTTIAGTASRSSDGRSVTFTPSSALPASTALTVTVSGIVSTDGVALAAQSWGFTTGAATTTSSSLFTSTTPAVTSSGDSAAVELGVSFVPSVNGSVTGVRFFKGTGSSGTHTGTLWSSTGTRLATVTFTNETASGWQTATFATPVDVTAGTTYVVSYYAPTGGYAYTANFFGSDFVNGPLTARAGNNGRFIYGSGGGFPTSSYQAANYFVDVVLATAGTS